MQDITLIQNLFFLLMFLFLSGFFSMSEGALFSLGKHHRAQINKEAKKNAKLIERLLKDPYKLIITIHLSDEILNVAYSSIMALTVRQLLPTYWNEGILTIFSICIASPSLLLLGEIGPKTIGVKYPRLIASIISYPLNLYHILITPLRLVIMALSIGITWILGGGKIEKDSKEGFSPEEMKALLGLGTQEGVLTDIEKKLVSNLFKLEHVRIYKLMTPGVNLFSLPADMTQHQAVTGIKRSGFSRVPIYKDDKNRIIGILYAKDLLSSDSSDTGNMIESILRPPFFIPKTKRAFDLLREFQQKRTQMAIVVDEYGRVDGVITMEDILEELFGEIEDERRTIRDSKVVRQGENLIIPGSMKIEEFNDSYLFTVLRGGGLSSLAEELEKSVIPIQEERETLGGFVFDLFGRFPNEGEQIRYGGLLLTVNKVSGKRISEVKVGRSDRGVTDVA